MTRSELAHAMAAQGVPFLPLHRYGIGLSCRPMGEWPTHQPAHLGVTSRGASGGAALELVRAPSGADRAQQPKETPCT